MRSSVWRFQTIGSIVLTFELIGSCLSAGQNRTPNPDQTRWETLKPQIEHVLIEDNILQQCDKDQTQITIDTATDTAGNRDPEAIVEYCHMGAYTSDALVMRLEHEKPVVVHFRESDGQIDDGNFCRAPRSCTESKCHCSPEKMPCTPFIGTLIRRENSRCVRLEPSVGTVKRRHLHGTCS